jgi:lipase
MRTTEFEIPPTPSRKSEPFQEYFDVPVAGGALHVARAGASPAECRAVVLALHGMTGTHMVYRTVARELSRDAADVCLLAPDLRGRGRSADLPGPYGMAVHVADLIAVLDHVGVDRAVVVGHSMGCSIASRFAADHPARAAAVVLLDGGLPLLPENIMSDEDTDGEAHGILDRFEARFATVDDYMAFWREHAGVRDAWDEDIEAFARRDFVVAPDGVRCAARLESVRTDVTDLMTDGVTWRSVERVRAPVRVMRAERGMYDDDPLIPRAELAEYLPEHPHVSAELVSGVNHFTLVLGEGHGPRRVAATLAGLAPSR